MSRITFCLQRRFGVACAVPLVLALFACACAPSTDDPPAGAISEDSDARDEPEVATPDDDSAPGQGADDPTPPPEADTGNLNPARLPSQNFDLRHWKLTLPSGEEVQSDELNSGYAYADVFYTDTTTGGMVFRCPNKAGTTANSQFSRTELREMLAPDGPAHADANNWTTADGGTLDATLRVDQVSTTGSEDKLGRVIIGQIHGPETEVIRLYYSRKPHEAKGRIYAGLDTVDNRNSYSADIVGNTQGGGIALGEVFSYRIKLEATRLSVVIRPQSGAASAYEKNIDPGYQGLNLYFKAGVYNQNNTGDRSDYAQATFFALEQRHP